MNARAWAFTVAGAVFVLDRVTKLIIKAQMSSLDQVTVIPGFFNVVHTENRGAAFGLFAESNGEWRSFLLIGLSTVVMVLLSAMLWHPARAGLSHSTLLRLGLSLVLGGAVGNLYDRVVHGAVTDFLQFYFGSYEFPSFNIADSAITIGAALLLIDMWLGHSHKHHAAPTHAPTHDSHVPQTDLDR